MTEELNDITDLPDGWYLQIAIPSTSDKRNGLIVAPAGSSRATDILVEIGAIDPTGDPKHPSVKAQCWVNRVGEDDFARLYRRGKLWTLVMDVVHDGTDDPPWAHGYEFHDAAVVRQWVDKLSEDKLLR